MPRTKLEMANIVFDNDISSVDFAIPKQWEDQMRELRVNPSYYVWSYKDNSHGEPINLAEKLFEKGV